MTNEAMGRDPDSTFSEGNTASVGATCGGVKSLATGKPLRGLAAQSQREVEAELPTGGRAAIVRRAAIRLADVARLFFDAILAAADSADVDVARNPPILAGDLAYNAVGRHRRRIVWRRRPEP